MILGKSRISDDEHFRLQRKRTFLHYSNKFMLCIHWHRQVRIDRRRGAVKYNFPQCNYTYLYTKFYQHSFVFIKYNTYMHTYYQGCKSDICSIMIDQTVEHAPKYEASIYFLFCGIIKLMVQYQELYYNFKNASQKSSNRK